jgi:CAAX prenyl protease-like protein
MGEHSTSLEHSSGPRKSLIRDDVAYIIPMAVFLLFTQAGVWWPAFYPASYIAKTFIVAILLVILWRHFTKIRWDYWWLGIVFGIVGIFQWIGIDDLYNFLLAHVLHMPAKPSTAFIPFEHFHSSAAAWAFISIRLAGATLLVPVMEELFWRDFLWRMIMAPNDFKLAEVGEPDWKAWLVVSIIFCFVHPQWLTAIVWGAMIGGLLMLTRSLGACIIMHGVTNLLLGLYVLKTGKWYFW